MANILVVDDDGAYRDSMTEYLRVKGHQAVSSEIGRASCRGRV